MNDLLHQWPHNFKQKQYLSFCKELPEEAWKHWANHFKENWPTDPIKRLAMIDDELTTHLNPQDLRPETVRIRRCYMRMTPNLNKHRGWALSLAINQIKRMAISQKETNNAYNLPEDLKTLSQDIAIFEKNKNDPEFYGREKYSIRSLRHLTLKNYPTGNDLLQHASLRRVKYPLKAADRLANHKKFLLEEGGNGHALRFASFNNGTEIIMPLTFEASKAYGSPRWCSVYSEPFFNKHSQKEPLCIIINERGNRWQTGLLSKRLSDEEDVSASYDKMPQNVASFLQTQMEAIASTLGKHLNRLSKTAPKIAHAVFFSAAKTPDLFIPLIKNQALSTQIINAKDEDGNTALDLAINDGCTDIVELIKGTIEAHQNEKRPPSRINAHNSAYRNQL